MFDVVCHLGLHKTASGTLQRQFFPACRGLNLLTTLDAAVRQFIVEVTRRDPLYFDPQRALRLLDGHLTSDRVNLLSNESLSGPPYAGLVEWGLDHRSPVLANLRAVFPQARAVVVLRRQDGLARSLYRQYLKRGGTVPARRFFGLEKCRRPPLMSLDRFHFSPFLRCVSESFGSRLLVLTFEEFVRDQQAFLEKLTRFIGVEKPQIELRSENATRLGSFGMETTRLMNFMFRGMLNHGVLPGIPVRRRGQWAQVSIVEFIHDYWPGRPDSRKDTPLSRAADEIWTMFLEDNRLVDREFGLNLAEYGYY